MRILRINSGEDSPQLVPAWSFLSVPCSNSPIQISMICNVETSCSQWAVFFCILYIIYIYEYLNFRHKFCWGGWMVFQAMTNETGDGSEFWFANPTGVSKYTNVQISFPLWQRKFIKEFIIYKYHGSISIGQTKSKGYSTKNDINANYSYTNLSVWTLHAQCTLYTHWNLKCTDCINRKSKYTNVQINCSNVQMFGAGSPKAESKWSDWGEKAEYLVSAAYSPFTVSCWLQLSFNCWSPTWLRFDVWDCIDRLGLRVAEIRGAIWHQSPPFYWPLNICCLNQPTNYLTNYFTTISSLHSFLLVYWE